MHEILLYDDGAAGFSRAALDPVRQALARDAPVLVVAREQQTSALRKALGAEAQRVRFLDAHERASNPARVFPLWQELAATGLGALAISELVWPGRSAGELEEVERQEQLLALAFAAGPPWRLLCAYDKDALGARELEAARLAHAAASAGARTCANANADAPPDPFAGSLPEPTADVQSLTFARQSLGDLRHALAIWAEGQGLEHERVEELVLAVNELAANSVRHAGGGGTLRYWREQDTLLCEVRDEGHIQEPLTGRLRPAPEAISGRGVWLVNQLCDLVQIRSSAAGSTVRALKRLP
jgi:anti-sigma regulatory factor (Ser/Thr protein kinase)